MNMRKTFSYRFFGREITITFAELVSGLVFLIMGLITIYYAFTANLAVHADYQIMLNIYFAKLSQSITNIVRPLTGWLWLIIVVIIGFLVFKITQKLINYFSEKKDEYK